MGPIGDTSANWTGATHNPASRSRALQKLNAPSDLHSGLNDQAPPRQDFSGPHENQNLACSGTADPVPFRYASRLVSPFVAQLLGQLLPDPETPVSQARAAYGINPPCTCLLLDTRL